jgi:hypothetical protein
MRPLSDLDPSSLSSVRYVLTDMDDTLTHNGQLPAQTYSALEALRIAGIPVIPVTAAPAGWCDQMARMWPIDGVIGENGGLFFRRSSRPQSIERIFWHPDTECSKISDALLEIGRTLCRNWPALMLADDQPFRLTSLAFRRPASPADRAMLVDLLVSAGASAADNNLWVLGWLGRYDKLAMTRRIMAQVYDVDIDNDPDSILYVGDSANDGPMFDFFRHTVGVSTVGEYLPVLKTPPAWITRGPGGAGFVEVTETLLAIHRNAI